MSPADDHQRLAVRLESGTHYIKNVSTAAVANAHPYVLRGYNDLRHLPLPAGGSRSMFRPDGMVAGTARGERFLFWPMGIASPGAMRQWGHHATAFVGVRHFDDPYLLEDTFRAGNNGKTP